MVSHPQDTIKKINLTLLNGTGYVFSVDDYLELRRNHRIVGALVGTCNTRGWSTHDSTLPVELTPHETRLLLERNIAQLVSKQHDLKRTPTASELVEYQQNLDTQLNAQAENFKAEKLRESERNMCKILAGKRKKLLKEGIPEQDINLNANDILKEIADNFVFERKNALLDIPCAHAAPHAFEIVQLPVDKSLKYRVFCELWSRGKFVTAGDVFGADFLLYPGDPLLYHASHIVILLPAPVVQPLDLIAKVRLSVIVNKVCVFAYFAATDAETDADDAEPSIHYQTVLWEGNRDREKLTASNMAVDSESFSSGGIEVVDKMSSHNIESS